MFAFGSGKVSDDVNLASEAPLLPDQPPKQEGEISTLEAAELKGLELTNMTTTGKPLTTRSQGGRE